VRDGLLNAWWATAFVPFVIIFGVIFALDAWRWAFDGTRRSFSKESFTRGFEPFEELFARLKEGYEDGEEEKKQRWLVSAAILVPLMVLAVPGGIIAYLATHGYKLPIAFALGVPSGIAMFLVLGFLGDLLGGSRTAGFSVLAAVPGFVLCFGYYPALANQLSPKEVFESYARIHKGSEPLALLGVGGRTAAYYAGGQVETLADTQRAFQWLTGAEPGTRRYLATRSEELPKLNQLSPKEVFESYARIHKNNEPLALLGVGGRTAAYYAGGQVETLTDTQHAFTWLLGADQGTRRYLATRSEELPKLNQLYRQQTHAHGEPAQNLPVLDARSSQILLVASSLQSSEKNQNPLSKILLDKVPSPQHKVVVDMEGKLQVLGYDVTDPTGKLVDVIGPGRKYRMRTYYKVTAPVTTEWEAFIHIDGYHRRHNGDHKPLDGKYPFSLWLKDDIVMDDYEFSLEPNFSPGTYTVFFGLFVGDTRMKVTSGPNDNDNRIDGGPLRVQ